MAHSMGGGLDGCVYFPYLLSEVFSININSVFMFPQEICRYENQS